MKKPSRPVAMTMCRMRGMSGGEACRRARCDSSVVKGSVEGEGGCGDQRMG